MAIELITGMSGTPHISSDDVRAFNRVMFGAGNYVLEGCEAQITSPNNVHINPGELMLGGGHSRITGTGENATIQNGAAGKVRTDAICVHYTRNSGGIESVAIQVVKGTDVATGNVPVAPSGSGSMANNDSDVVTVLYLVDVTVSGVENLRKHEGVGEKPNVTADVLPLSVENGGTGATTLEEAKKKLTFTPSWVIYEEPDGSSNKTYNGGKGSDWVATKWSYIDSPRTTGMTSADEFTSEYFTTALGSENKATSNNSLITIVKPGLYRFSAAHFASTNSGRIGVSIRRNNAQILETMLATTGTQVGAFGESIVKCNAGDIVGVAFFISASATSFQQYLWRSYKYFNIQYLGE